jgi:hypothetical protein
LFKPRSVVFLLTVTSLACPARRPNVSDGGADAAGGSAGSSGLAGAPAPYDGGAGGVGVMTGVGGVAGQQYPVSTGGTLNVWADGGQGMFDPQLPPAVVEACERVRRSDYAPAADKATAGRALVGRFVLCTTRGMWDRPHAGLSIGADGRIALLEWTPDGLGLRPLTGMENEGAIDLAYFDGYGQVNFGTDTDLVMMLRPLFGQSPHSFRFNSHDGPYAYVSAAELYPQPAVAPAPPVSGSLVGQAACEQSAGPRRPVATVAQARAVMSRRWLFCRGVGVFTEGPVDGGRGLPHAGLEITLDDRFYFLDRTADGQLARRADSSSETTIEYLAHEANGAEPAHVTASFHMARGYSSSNVVVSEAPVVFLLGSSGIVGRYVPAE